MRAKIEGGESSDKIGGFDPAATPLGTDEADIKAWKSHLAADRTSCPKATANLSVVPALR